MILESILSVVSFLVTFILNLLPSLPQVPESFSTTIDTVLSMIFDNGGALISLFIRPETITIVVPILIILVNFEYIYKLIMWIVKKLPLSIN